jgi:hypothetical protein
LSIRLPPVLDFTKSAPAMYEQRHASGLRLSFLCAKLGLGTRKQQRPSRQATGAAKALQRGSP